MVSFKFLTFNTWSSAVFKYNSVYLWLCWVVIDVRGLCLVVESGGYSLLQALITQISIVVAHRLSCSAACGIFPDQGLNPCPLRWQGHSYPLHHLVTPFCFFKKTFLRSTLTLTYQVEWLVFNFLNINDFFPYGVI